MALTRQQLTEDLRRLGVGPGMTLMVHSSLSALGRIEGGANTLIEALLAAIGPEGTLAMPAMSGGVFDLATSPSNVGSVTEAFRHYPGVTRSFHPTHSACAIGPMTDYLLRDSLAPSTAIGTESPWGRLSRLTEGYVLLLGVDQDRNTLMHYPEEVVRAPYLSTIERQYRDADGTVHTKVMEHFPGPHRDFIGFDAAFREGGAMRVGKVGDAACRLLHAGQAVEIEVAALRRDPASVLCDNPNCDDCVMQRAKIKAHDLAQHDFTACALLDELVDDLALASDGGEWAGGLQAVWNEGIRSVELGERLGGQLLDGGAAADAFGEVLRRRGMTVGCLHCGLSPADFMGDAGAVRERVCQAAEVADALGAALVKVPSPPGARTRMRRRRACARRCRPRSTRRSPSSLRTRRRAAGTAGGPVRQRCWRWRASTASPSPSAPRTSRTWARGRFWAPTAGPSSSGTRASSTRRMGCRPGRPRYTLPLQGNGEVKELVSIFACRSFDGLLTLKMGDRTGTEAFKQQAAAFRRLLATC